MSLLSSCLSAASTRTSPVSASSKILPRNRGARFPSTTISMPSAVNSCPNGFRTRRLQWRGVTHVVHCAQNSHLVVLEEGLVDMLARPPVAGITYRGDDQARPEGRWNRVLRALDPGQNSLPAVGADAPPRLVRTGRAHTPMLPLGAPF